MSYKENINYTEYDAIIFDIDGVLIDIINSYNQTIIKTIQHILNFNFRFNIDIIDFPIEKLISKFRHTGGFNNDIDTTYSIILIIVYCKSINKCEINEIFNFFINILERIDDKGIISIEKELEKIGDIENIKIKLGYPKDDNIISTVFNEIFYGPDLFRKQFNKKPKYYFDKPLINNDKIIIKEKTIQDLSKEFNGKLILVSGRSKIASYFTLNKFVDYFIKDACIFLEDERREYSKPNTYAMHRVFNQLKLKNAIYVGDSIEDLLMVEKFRDESNGRKIIFCGVYGTNISSSEDLKRLWELKGADIIVENVNDIPNILNNTEK
ncbi:MAG: HAD-IA family hydrolase [Nitrosopumilus sp.]|nr:HAD-IA family hydrolase [Nitrosopumilus sp.]